jgi:hypothetical protein
MGKASTAKERFCSISSRRMSRQKYIILTVFETVVALLQANDLTGCYNTFSLEIRCGQQLGAHPFKIAEPE